MISREVSKGVISDVKEERDLSGESKRKVDGVLGSKGEVVEVQNGEKEKEKDGEGVQHGKRRRSKANMRLSNQPKAAVAHCSVWGSTRWLDFAKVHCCRFYPIYLVLSKVKLMIEY